MTLGTLIQILSAMDPKQVVEEGFVNPHSFRGYYNELAFEPAMHQKVSDMLKAAKSAVGETYTGWKGGHFTMDLSTPVWIAFEGGTGPFEHSVSEPELAKMFGVPNETLRAIFSVETEVTADGFVAGLGIKVPKKFKLSFDSSKMRCSLIPNGVNG